MADDLYQRYETDGFAVARGVFGAAEVAELVAAFDSVWRLGRALPANCRHGNSYFALGDDPAIGRFPRMVQWPAYFEPVLARYRTDPRLLALVEPLIGRDLKQIINQMHWKPPGADGTDFGFHQDIRFRRPAAAYREPARSYVQTGIAIDRHDAATGAMAFVRGSHLKGPIELDIRGRVMDTAVSEQALTDAGLDPADLVTPELEPGDVAFWGLNTVHGSGPNRARGRRRIYLNGYVIAANCDRGEWAFRNGAPCPLGPPRLVHYEDLYAHPGPFFETP